MLAQRIATILPPLEFEEALEITKICSIKGVTAKGETIVSRHPFRSPHHSSSLVSLTGGGTWPRPGEISMAHHGILFLDELPEFHRDVIEALRNPLEDGHITICRAKTQITFPARFMLVAAMNPCPCGFLSDPHRACRCSMGQIQKYRSRISGPLLDRIDLHIEVPAVPSQALLQNEPTEDSEAIRERVVKCRQIQTRRFRECAGKVNALMRARETKRYATPDTDGRKLLAMAMKELRLSARAYFKILKIARTIADLAGMENISSEHIAEAIQYRSLDRHWGP